MDVDFFCFVFFSFLETDRFVDAADRVWRRRRRRRIGVAHVDAVVVFRDAGVAQHDAGGVGVLDLPAPPPLGGALVVAQLHAVAVRPSGDSFFLDLCFVSFLFLSASKSFHFFSIALMLYHGIEVPWLDDYLDFVDEGLVSLCKKKGKDVRFSFVWFSFCLPPNRRCVSHRFFVVLFRKCSLRDPVDPSPHAVSLSLSPADSVHRPADGRLDAAAATTSTTTTTAALSAASAASATSAASSSATAAAAASTLRSAVGVPAVAAAVHRRRSGAHGDDRSPRRARRRRGRFLYRTLFFLYFSFFFFVFINAGMPRSDPAAPKKNAVAPLPIARAVVWLLFYVERSAFSTLFSSSISSKQSQSRFFRVFSLALEKFGSIGFCFSISSNFHLAGHSSDCGAFPRQSFVLFLFFFVCRS